MAPACKVTQIGKDKTNLRKPVMEKKHRDRINKSIERLKVLLKAEIKAMQPCSELEKADVLEMAVVYLQSNSWPLVSPNSSTPAAQSHTDGFSRCLEETGRYLSLHNQQQTTKPALIKHVDAIQLPKVSAKSVPSAHKYNCEIFSQRSGDHQELWRPW
ncbi:transcription factor HES-5-like [Myxocyprinus asiaticus]|uniref:transcription factor HES-5-like n=1 Tax=Myxocyprinus asiaticus TaxID=70543 RepID=UPI002222548B|nr:transcription factor HES-5-like [Myxocyprinus asiaticus]